MALLSGLQPLIMHTLQIIRMKIFSLKNQKMLKLLRKLFFIEYFAAKRAEKNAQMELAKKLEELRRRDPFIYR